MHQSSSELFCTLILGARSHSVNATSTSLLSHSYLSKNHSQMMSRKYYTFRWMGASANSSWWSKPSRQNRQIMSCHSISDTWKYLALFASLPTVIIEKTKHRSICLDVILNIGSLPLMNGAKNLLTTASVHFFSLVVSPPTPASVNVKL